MSVFQYPSQPHTRVHGPAGYANYRAYKEWLRDEFVFRCVYCLVREVWYPNGAAAFSADHFTPQTRAPELVRDYDNLLYACIRCNSLKQDADVLDPCRVALGEYLEVREDGTIHATTPEALEHVLILGLDDERLTLYRAEMLRRLKRLANLPGEESKEELRALLRFPLNLPNLGAMRPPGGNTRPEGVAGCHYNRRRAGTLPETY